MESAVALFVPLPLQGRTAWTWLRATAADFALIGVNWLMIGALLVLPRYFPPHGGMFERAAGVPFSFLGIAVLHAALITLMGYGEGLYDGRHDLRGQARILGKAILWATAVLAGAYGLQGAPWLIAALFCGAGLLHFGTLWAWRWRNRRRQAFAGCDGDMRNVLIIGGGGVGRRVASHVEGHPETRRRVCGFLDDKKPLGDGIIGRVTDLARLARTGFVDEVILAGSHPRELALQVVREARRLQLDLEIVPDLFGCKPEGNGFERVGDLPVICLHAERLPAAALVLKRLLDVVGAGLALMMLSPLLAAVSGFIKLDSRGPVLYSAPRAGRKGRPFHCHKFRTMVSNADELKNNLRQRNQRSGPIFKIADDPRITRVGRWLRKYSLDELPQLWNVLKGDMSLVGPRPHPLDDFAAYEIEHLGRLDVTPGITGLWQVVARRDPSFQRGMELDREYIRTWSLRTDMTILLKTFMAVVRGSGE